MIHWLHRYIFRGIGVVFVIGVITMLLIMINQFRHLATASDQVGHQVQGGQR